MLWGRLPRERALSTAANFDIAVYPRTEDTGIQAAKVAEFIGLGVPTVSYDYRVTANLRELDAGVLVEGPDEFVAAVVDLATDEIRRRPSRRRQPPPGERSTGTSSLGGTRRSWRPTCRPARAAPDRRKGRGGDERIALPTRQSQPPDRGAGCERPDCPSSAHAASVRGSQTRASPTRTTIAAADAAASGCSAARASSVVDARAAGAAKRGTIHASATRSVTSVERATPRFPRRTRGRRRARGWRGSSRSRRLRLRVASPARSRTASARRSAGERGERPRESTSTA